MFSLGDPVLYLSGINTTNFEIILNLPRRNLHSQIVAVHNHRSTHDMWWREKESFINRTENSKTKGTLIEKENHAIFENDARKTRKRNIQGSKTMRLKTRIQKSQR